MLELVAAAQIGGHVEQVDLLADGFLTAAALTGAYERMASYREDTGAGRARDGCKRLNRTRWR